MEGWRWGRKRRSLAIMAPSFPFFPLRRWFMESMAGDGGGVDGKRVTVENSMRIHYHANSLARQKSRRRRRRRHRHSDVTDARPSLMMMLMTSPRNLVSLRLFLPSLGAITYIWAIRRRDVASRFCPSLTSPQVSEASVASFWYSL